MNRHVLINGMPRSINGYICTVFLCIWFRKTNSFHTLFNSIHILSITHNETKIGSIDKHQEYCWSCLKIVIIKSTTYYYSFWKFNWHIFWCDITSVLNQNGPSCSCEHLLFCVSYYVEPNWRYLNTLTVHTFTY